MIDVSEEVAMMIGSMDNPREALKVTFECGDNKFSSFYVCSGYSIPVIKYDDRGFESHPSVEMKLIPSIKVETPEEKEALDSIKPVEWDGWDEGGYASSFPDAPGVQVSAFIMSEANGINGPMGKWVNATSVTKYMAENGGWGLIVSRDGINHAIGATTHLKKPETPQQREERERDEAIADMYIECGGDSSDIGHETMGSDCYETCKQLYAAGYRKLKDA